MTTGRFEITSWAEEVGDEAEGAKLARASLTKAFEGGIAGTSAATILTAVTPGGGAAYVGIERVDAVLDGRKGTFVLRHSALDDGAGGGDLAVDVVPGSGTGELAGIDGTLTIERSPEGEHTYAFAYTLP